MLRPLLLPRTNLSLKELVLRRVATGAPVATRRKTNSFKNGAATAEYSHKSPPPRPAKAFMDLGLPSMVASALARQSISVPTLIQRTAIPRVLSGRNTLIAAETGSGKTFAYLAPLVARLKASDPDRDCRRPGRPRVIILVPTRELVMQVVSVAKSLTYDCRFSVREALGGGGATAARRKSLRKLLETQPVDLLVATPGMLASMRERQLVFLSELQTVVIDEADVTLAAQGFEEQVAPFLAAVDAKPKLSPPQKPAQFVYAGASLPAGVRWRIQKRHSDDDLSHHQNVLLDTPSNAPDAGSSLKPSSGALDLQVARTESLHVATPPKLVKTKFIRVSGGESGKLKRAANEIADLGRRAGTSKIMVFCDRGNRRDQLVEMVNGMMPDGLSAVHMTGQASADRYDRWRDWGSFREDPNVPVAICAQSFSRGIDIPSVRHIVMTDVPMTGTEYLHRVGRIRAPDVDEKASITVIVSSRDRAVAEALFLAHVREDDLSALNAPSAWRAYVDASRNRIATDPIVMRARKMKRAFWIDERVANSDDSHNGGPVRQRTRVWRQGQAPGGGVSKSGTRSSYGRRVERLSSQAHKRSTSNGRHSDNLQFRKSRDSRRAHRYESKRYADAGPYGGARR